MDDEEDKDEDEDEEDEDEEDGEKDADADGNDGSIFTTTFFLGRFSISCNVYRSCNCDA